MTSLYYTAPSDEIFEEVKNEAIDLWENLDSHPSYIEEKTNRIRDIKNVGDNVMYIVAMFDFGNQAKLAGTLSVVARAAVRDRMRDGGQPLFAIPF